jgi:hypothetical protein
MTAAAVATSERGGASVMRVTVTSDPSAGPLLIAVEGPELADADVADFTEAMTVAATRWWHGDPAPTPEEPEAPAPPDPPDAQVDQVSQVDAVRQAAYVLLDRDRSVAQVAALLEVDRDQVRAWARGARR